MITTMFDLLSSLPPRRRWLAVLFGFALIAVGLALDAVR
jgi:hypothetical protein